MYISVPYRFLNKYHEYIPVVSTFTSLSKIFRAKVLQTPDIFLKEHRFISLRKKMPIRIIILLIPIAGNVIVGIYDFKKYSDRCFTLKAVRANGLSLQYATDENKDCKKVVQEALKNNIHSYKYASYRLRNHPTFFSEEMKSDISILLFSCDEKRKSRKFVYEMMKKFGPKVILYAHNMVQNDKLFILHLMDEFPEVLKYTSLSCYKKFVQELTAINPSYFQYAHKSLRNSEKYVAKLMMPKNQNVLKYAGNFLRSNETFILQQMLLCGEALTFSALNNNKVFIAKCLKNDLSIFMYTANEIKDDWSFMTQFQQDNFKIFKFAKNEMRADLKTIIKGIEECGLSSDWIDPPFNYKDEVILTYVKRGLFNELEKMNQNTKKNNALALKASTINGEALCYFDDTLINSKEHLLVAIKTSLLPLKKISKSSKENQALFFELIKVNPEAFNYTCTSFQNDAVFIRQASRINMEVLKHTKFGPEVLDESSWAVYKYYRDQI
jgi:hypothetical protein